MLSHEERGVWERYARLHQYQVGYHGHGSLLVLSTVVEGRETSVAEELEGLQIVVQRPEGTAPGFFLCDEAFLIRSREPERARLAEKTHKRLRRLLDNAPTDDAMEASFLPHRREARSPASGDQAFDGRFRLLSAASPAWPPALRQALRELPSPLGLCASGSLVRVTLPAAELGEALVRRAVGVAGLLTPPGSTRS